MKDINSFYNIISPLVLDHKFCLDTELIKTNKKHPKCPSNPMSKGIVAGIKKKNGKLKPFLTRSKRESFFDTTIIGFILLYIIIIKTYVLIKI